MLFEQKVAAALSAKQMTFTQRESTFTRTLTTYREALNALGVTFPDAAALESVLEGQEATGARPLAGEYDPCIARNQPDAPPVVPFPPSFAHHEASYAWAERIIAGVTTVAVDGSQIMPWGDASIPVALVQAGIFVNPHSTTQPYTKDVIVEILGPDDFAPDPDEIDDETILNMAAEDLVTLHRFEIETRTLAAWIRAYQHPTGAALPVVLLDGSLIVSFSLRMLPGQRERYVAAVADLLLASEQARVPLLAYIDTSRARDLTTMLRVAFPERKLPDNKRIYDALLWGDALGWGDASPPFLSARGAVSQQFGTQRSAVAFVYLRAALDRPPARVEMPRWLAESASLGHALDVLRAELIAGGGYPYAIETADAVAVISNQDRMRFLGMFQRFADESGLDLRFSHKALSKSRRRL